MVHTTPLLKHYLLSARLHVRAQQTADMILPASGRKLGSTKRDFHLEGH